MKLPQFLIAIACVLLSLGPNSHAESAPSQEYLIKAAFIYNFAMFVEWPRDAFKREDSPIVIGIVGADPFGPAIDRTVGDKKVKGRPIVVKRLQWGQELKDCQILFINSSEMPRMDELHQLLKDDPVLTIGESGSFAKLGGIINFKLEDKKVRFEINTDAAKRAHLNISSKLLSLARIIE